MPVGLTFNAGERLYAADLMTLVAAVDAANSPDICIARRVANQSITNATSTPISLDTQDVDTNGMFAATDSKIYCVTSGVHHVTGFIICVQPSGLMLASIFVNGSASAVVEQSVNVDASGATRNSVSCDVDLTAGDYVELGCYQSSSGSRNATGRLSVSRTGES